jgi:hypothetical protein
MQTIITPFPIFPKSPLILASAKSSRLKSLLRFEENSIQMQGFEKKKTQVIGLQNTMVKHE